MINKFKTFIQDNKKDLSYILALTSILLIISIPKLYLQYSIGIGNWDTYLYLENGRNFAKMGWGDVSSIAPVLPMILSKIFLITGHTFQEAIFNVDVISYIIGVIFLYLILRFKFNENVSLVGSFIYATFTLLFSWVAIGGNDIIGVSGTLATIYLILAAHKYNTKIYYIALPIAAYSFLTRYTAGIMAFAIVFYLIINRINLKEIRDIIIGFILGVISISWFLNQFNKVLGTPFPFLGQFSGTVSNTQVMDSGYLPDTWYYITHIPNYLSSMIPPRSTFNAVVNPMGNIPTILSYLYIILMIIGFVVILYQTYKIIKNSDKKYLTTENILLLNTVAILSIVCIITLSQVSYITTFILFFIIMGLIWLTLYQYNIDTLDYDLLMISLFVIYIVFQSILSTKNDRYFITVLPFIAYFIANAVNSIYNYVDDKIITKNVKPTTILTALIIVFLVINSLAFVSSIPQNNHYKDVEDACYWLNETHAPLNNTTIIYSDNWPGATWYLNLYIQRGVPDTNIENSSIEFSKQILASNSSHSPASYYIETNKVTDGNYPGLTAIKRIGDVTIYENNYLLEDTDKNLTTQEYKDYLNRTLSNYYKIGGEY